MSATGAVVPGPLPEPPRYAPPDEQQWVPAALRTKLPPKTVPRETTRARYQQLLKDKEVKMYEDALAEALRRERLAATGVTPDAMNFRIKCDTRFGQNLYLVGSVEPLGLWDPSRAVKMTWNEGNMWTCTVNLPVSIGEVEYKYIVRQDNMVDWEHGHNHKLNSVQGGVTVEDAWGQGRG
ncbi:unnamed protein product [Vitrella brassicaformis CCMP3155]|uniref:CBM20 domain-containing protein n=1 Tax=Vitrella brassicaformis (strain CCMP3155) TaxID=1169540 RepID=A0A0G4FB95_VITBC|nr:unnamed protein product [Vitrella brassicaformis CCMP3155]|eukprot:CEM10154.1 unnamed protein product [Vitrella brassicaformis CCMP3155]